MSTFHAVVKLQNSMGLGLAVCLQANWNEHAVRDTSLPFLDMCPIPFNILQLNIHFIINKSLP